MLCTVLEYQVSLWYLNCEFWGYLIAFCFAMAYFLSYFQFSRLCFLWWLTLLFALYGFDALQLTWLFSFSRHLLTVHFDVIDWWQYVIDSHIFSHDFLGTLLFHILVYQVSFSLFNKIWILCSHYLNYRFSSLIHYEIEVWHKIVLLYFGLHVVVLWGLALAQ